MDGRRVLVDGWYSWTVPHFLALSDVTGGWPKPLRRLLARFGPLRGLVLFVVGRRYDAVAVIRADPGWRTTLLAHALARRRPRLIVFHFIDHPPREGGIGRLLDMAWRAVDRWAARRAVLAAQVLSPGELERYPREFGIPQERFRLIPFAWRTARELPKAAGDDARQAVVAIGRAACDWRTLFAAARGAGWPLTVVCGTRDRALVEELNADGRASVHCEIPFERVQQLLRHSAVCVLPMFDASYSHGQVRLCNAVDAGAAVVASRTGSLEGYAIDGETALLIPPEDPRAMRDAIDRLMAQPAERERLARAAFERAAQWTGDHYVDALNELLQACDAG